MCTRRPLAITIKTFDSVVVYIPRSFKGLLHLVHSSDYGNLNYSMEVKAQVTTISSVDGKFGRSTHKSFIEEYNLSEWEDGGKFWPGDELEIDAFRTINIYYDDEVQTTAPPTDTSAGGCVVM